MAGLDTFVALLLHFDGADNSTVITDSSYVATKSVSRTNALIKTAESKFGGSSFYCDGTGDYASVPDHADWDFGTEDFTIDCWIKVSATSADYAICSLYTADNNKILFYVSSQTLAFLAYSSAGVKAVDIKGTGTQLNDNAWHHVAAVRSGTGANSLKLYIDGTAIAVTTTTDLAGNTLPNLTAAFEIGRQNNSSAYKYFNGYIDEYRVSKGIARWTSNFTPPTEAYSRMGLYFIDLDNGNDALLGESWVTAWKSIKYGATAGRVLPADVFRVSKTPDPVSIGSCGCENLSKVIHLPSALTLDICDCENAWTASANVTSTADGDAKQGLYSAKLSIAVGFTTGKVAYRNLGTTINCSGYSALSLWFKNTVLYTGSHLKICLCSDISGETIVDEFVVPSMPIGNNPYWAPVRIPKGSVLGSSIKSVALYATSDPGTCIVYLDNIIACDDLSLKSLISKNSLATGGTEPWWAIQSMSGEYALLDDGANCQSENGFGYWGITETTTWYRREPVSFPDGTNGTIQDGGSDGNLVEFQGGWNISSGLQDGETFIDGVCSMGFGINYNAKSYLKCSRFSAVRCNTGFDLSSGIKNEYHGQNSGNHVAYGVAAGGIDPVIRIQCVNNVENSSIYFGNASINADCIVENIFGTHIGIYFRGIGGKIVFGDICNINDSGVNVSFGRGGIIVGNNIKHCFGVPSYAADFNYDITGPCYLYNINFEDNNHQINAQNVAPVYLKNCTFDTLDILNGPINFDCPVVFIKYDGNIDDNRSYYAYFNIVSQTDVRYTASGIAWKISVTNTTFITSSRPAFIPFGKVGITAGTTVTISCQMQRTHIDIIPSLIVKGYQLAGIDDDVKSTMTAVADTWEEVSISLTPTETGVLEFGVEVYGGSTYSVYIDNFVITQA